MSGLICLLERVLVPADTARTNGQLQQTMLHNLELLLISMGKWISTRQTNRTIMPLVAPLSFQLFLILRVLILRVFSNRLQPSRPLSHRRLPILMPATAMVLALLHSRLPRYRMNAQITLCYSIIFSRGILRFPIAMI